MSKTGFLDELFLLPLIGVQLFLMAFLQISSNNWFLEKPAKGQIRNLSLVKLLVCFGYNQTSQVELHLVQTYFRKASKNSYMQFLRYICIID